MFHSPAKAAVNLRDITSPEEAAQLLRQVYGDAAKAVALHRALERRRLAQPHSEEFWHDVLKLLTEWWN